MTQESPTSRPPRHAIRLSADLVVDGQSLTGMTRNLSMGGVCVEVHRPILEGKLLRITLFVVEDDVETEGIRGLELTGTVQWAAESHLGYRVGIKFGSLNATQSTSLSRALGAIGDPGR